MCIRDRSKEHEYNSWTKEEKEKNTANEPHQAKKKSFLDQDIRIKHRAQSQVEVHQFFPFKRKKKTKNKKTKKTKLKLKPPVLCQISGFTESDKLQEKFI
eukprot:TRINITY_DN3555_c0_g1_i7.p2 TRINITY_DN3555_c0_g1~~TRINITY_DN3555_c0_g1_i7.p2  ORF type:complete len:100 (-),score=14.58 TRINITY_DN3555_c0_g1_i7:81-380(-)